MKKLVWLVSILLIVGSILPTYAQGGPGGAPAGGGTTPSAQGGANGSPGMAGATGNTMQGRNSSSVSPAMGGGMGGQAGGAPQGGGQVGGAPQGGQVGGPQGGQAGGPQAGQAGGPQAGQAGGPQAGQAGGPQAGQAGGPQAGQAGGPQAGQAGGPQAGQAGGPQAGQAGGPQAGQAGGPQVGQAPIELGGLSGGLQGLFGGDASPRPVQFFQEGMSWLGFGGFGASAVNQVPPTGATTALNGQWNPTAGAVTTAPSTMADTSAVIAAQQTAQADAVASTAAGNTQTAASEAQTAAQQTYDQFWTDYYSAVDYASISYYDTVTASVDYAQEAYYEALDYTTEPVSYYTEYAAEYAEYCYYYPWDCYSYTYDSTTQTYTDVSYVSDEPVATVETVAVTSTWTDTSTATPQSSAEAYEALVVFANDQLGTVVQPLYAGEITQEVQLVLATLPSEVEGYAALLSSADPAYWGLLNGGVGVVGTVNCTSGCEGTNIPAELSVNSAGVYMLTAAATMPTDDATALDLITTVYPATNGMAFAKVTNAETGFTYMATAYGLGQGQSVAKMVYAGVMDLNGQTTVYVLVLVGQAQIDAFFTMLSGS